MKITPGFIHALPSLSVLILLSLLVIGITACQKSAVEHHTEYSVANIESLLKECAPRNGGPVFPMHHHVTQEITQRLGGRPDSLEAIDKIYPEIRDQSLARLHRELPACMIWQPPAPTDDKICNQFIECQKEIFPYRPE